MGLMMTRLTRVAHRSSHRPLASLWSLFPVREMPDYVEFDLGPLPPLPKIRSEAIRSQIFTHRSVYARPTHVFEDHPDDPSPDNEKYEHLGDTVLSLVVTNLLLEMYPGLRVGPSTKIRALIVGNVNLADISLKYKLPNMLRLHTAQALSLRASPHVQADVFEAFVGGLYLDQGLEAVQDWLCRVFRPYVTAAYGIIRTQHGLPPLPPPSTSRMSDTGSNTDNDSLTTIGHLALFNQELQKGNRQVEWIYSTPESTHMVTEAEGLEAEILKGIKSTPVWFVEVKVDGEVLGMGRGNTKKSARNEAAKEGLHQLGMKFCLELDTPIISPDWG